jgi:hypothetical protein
VWELPDSEEERMRERQETVETEVTEEGSTEL